MLKKYFPLVILAAASGLFLYIKMHQRGALPAQPGTVQIGTPSRGEEGFNRRTSHIFYSKHARCRMECRHIDENEVREILEEGTVNYSKIEDDGRGKTYPLEGITHEHQHLRIVFAPKDDGLLVVTCIDLDTEWSCDCK